MGTENQWNSDLVPHIHFKNNFLLKTKVISEWKKRRSKQVSNPLDLLKTTLLKNNAQPEKQNFIMKNGNKARDVLGDSRQHYRTLRTNQMARFVTVPFKKKKYLDQLTLSKLLRKDRGCVQRFSIDADVSRSHFTSLLFCRGSQEYLSTHVHINCFCLLNPLSHDLRALYPLARCNSWISLLHAFGFLRKTCWACLFACVSHKASTEIFYRSFVFGSLPIQRMQLAELFPRHHRFCKRWSAKCARKSKPTARGKK